MSAGSALPPVREDRTLWVKLSLLDVDELHARIDAAIRADRQALVLNVNAHCMNLAWEQPWLRRFLDDAAVVFCDGAGVALALRLAGGPRVPQRITYAEWMWQLAAFCEKHGHSLYFVGGRPGVAQQAAERLRERHPGLVIAGCHHGYFERTGAENARVVATIAASGARILVVGFGMPIQERWLADNCAALPPMVFLTGGAAFDYVAGVARRGPRLLTDHGFEWAVRLAQEPARLWRRYLLGNPLFLLRVALHRLGVRPAGAEKS